MNGVRSHRPDEEGAEDACAMLMKELPYGRVQIRNIGYLKILIINLSYGPSNYCYYKPLCGNLCIGCWEKKLLFICVCIYICVHTCVDIYLYVCPLLWRSEDEVLCLPQWVSTLFFETGFLSQTWTYMADLTNSLWNWTLSFWRLGLQVNWSICGL